MFIPFFFFFYKFNVYTFISKIPEHKASLQLPTIQDLEINQGAAFKLYLTQITQQEWPNMLRKERN